MIADAQRLVCNRDPDIRRTTTNSIVGLMSDLKALDALIGNGGAHRKAIELEVSSVEGGGHVRGT